MVEDTGTGMSPEQIARILPPADRTTGPEGSNGGIGLVMIRRILRAMGTDLKVKSEEGGGSGFSFELELPVPRTGDPMIQARPRAL